MVFPHISAFGLRDTTMTLKTVM